MPKISVIMPVYNAAPFLKESIESILNQTYKDFEFLIFNDGSTDNSMEIIESFKDPRIKFFNSSKNYGLIKHLNEGIKLANGEYIARMDADDISRPRRFEKQVEFLDQNKEYGICGGNLMIIKPSGKKYYWLYPKEDEEIRVRQFFNVGFAHPTVMIRKILFEKTELYNQDYYSAEDYDLWFRLLKISKGYNINEVTLKYRIHNQQVSTIQGTKQNKLSGLIRARYLNDLNITLNENMIAYHNDIIILPWKNEDQFIQEAIEWVNFIIAQNNSIKLFNTLIFNNSISKLVINKLDTLTNKNFDGYYYYRSSGLYEYNKLEKSYIIKLKLKYYLKNA